MAVGRSGWNSVHEHPMSIADACEVSIPSSDQCRVAELCPRRVTHCSLGVRYQCAIILQLAYRVLGMIILQMYADTLFGSMSVDQIVKVVADIAFRPPLHLVTDAEVRDAVHLLLHYDAGQRTLPRR